MVEVGSLVFLPARDSSIPELADEDELPVANGLILGSSYGTIPLGAGAFAVLSVFFGTSGWFSATSTALWLDAVTFVVSFLFIRRIGSLRNEGDHAPGAHHVRMLDAFRLPLVRALVAPAVVAAVGIGSLFSLGVVFVQHVLGANDTEFGVLVVMFGIGAALGLVVLRLARWKSIRVVRASLGVQGVVIAGMSCAPVIALVFVGALGFGGATAITLTSAITVLQERLDDQDRVEAFTTFHVLIRAGLGIAALAAGAAGDAISGVSWPFVGHLAPARVVLFASGVVVIATAALSGRWTKQIAKEPA
jgi:dTMP kinase